MINSNVNRPLTSHSTRQATILPNQPYKVRQVLSFKKSYGGRHRLPVNFALDPDCHIGVLMARCHKNPTNAVVKELYANAFKCAFPDCNQPLYTTDLATGSRRLNSRVAHICARCEGGPRWDPKQSEAENRSFDNLILLCIEHAAEVDDAGRAIKYPPALLRSWKDIQLRHFEKIGQRWILTDNEVDEVARVSFPLSQISISDSTISMGGKGGRAIGSGGGRGGAIGPGASGGEGGPGGRVSLRGQDGQAPGSGGGGGGAIGDGAFGGEGGELQFGLFRAEDLPPSVQIKIGRGGKGGEKGTDGKDGEDSSFGDLLRAKGGKGGCAGNAQPSYRQVGVEEMGTGK